MGITSETDLIEWISRILADPAHDDSPLREPLARLFELSTHQRERMERLIRISDGFHGVALDRKDSLAESYDRHLRRLEKLIRISDRYQEGMRELSESLQEAALKDPLTGMGNRRYLIERLREEMDRSRRKGKPLTVALLDIDHFKSVNDDFGHDVGDRLLCRIGEAITESLRDYDVCGRWGGEEFLLFFPETDLDAAREVCERVRVAIRAIGPVEGMSGARGITASVGLSRLGESEGFSETISRADSLLMEAKESGRDRLLISPAP